MIFLHPAEMIQLIFALLKIMSDQTAATPAQTESKPQHKLVYCVHCQDTVRYAHACCGPVLTDKPQKKSTETSPHSNS